MLSEAQIERYARHILLREVGGVGQERILAARVELLGLDEVGAWAATYLALAGVGELVLSDPRPILSPLPVLGVNSLGGPRDAALAAAVPALNPDVRASVKDASGPERGSLLRVGGAELRAVAGGEGPWVWWNACPRCADDAGEADPAAAALAGSLAAAQVLQAILAVGAPPRGPIGPAVPCCPHGW